MIVDVDTEANMQNRVCLRKTCLVVTSDTQATLMLSLNKALLIKKSVSRKTNRISTSNRPEVFCKKVFLNVSSSIKLQVINLINFAKFTGHHLYQKFFLNKVAV